VPFLTTAELAAWAATIDTSDPMLREFAGDLQEIVDGGADERLAVLELLRDAAEQEAALRWRTSAVAGPGDVPRPAVK
jgi:hypothetical protein